MKTPHQLGREELEDIVNAIQQILYLDNQPEERFFWNPDKEWDCADAFDEIALKQRDHDLVPSHSAPFQSS